VPHPPSLPGLFIYSLHGEVPLPLSSGAFLMTATVTSFPYSKVAGWGPPLLPSLASFFIYSSHKGVPFPHSPELRAPCPLCYVSFFSSCLLFSFFSFFPGQGSVCPGGYADLAQGCLWEYHVLLICSPGGLHLPSRVGAGVWWCGSPPSFSI
jgi:hypothetical protein